MIKNILIAILIALTAVCIALAWRNAKPICQDLQRQGDNLICVYDLGEIQEDEADVIIVN